MSDLIKTIEARLITLNADYKKGTETLDKINYQLLRIEGAIHILEEILKDQKEIKE